MAIAVLVFFPFVAGIFIWFLCTDKQSQKSRDIAANAMIAVSAVELAAAVYSMLGNGADIVNRDIWGVNGLTFSFVYSGFRSFFGTLTAFAWFVVILFSKEYMKNDTYVLKYDFFNLLTLGATMGIFYAGDFFTLFFFFEIMSFTSFVWVAHRQTKESAYAAGMYLGIAVAGGLAVLMGLFLLYAQCGSLVFEDIALAVQDSLAGEAGGKQSKTLLYVAAGCLLAGFGVKASAFPVHVWLPQSYTQAPAPATALLSAILSKTGIWGIVMVTYAMFPNNGGWGMTVLIVGVITMLVGGLRGVASSNLKTTMAYSSMSQIGFVLLGVGMCAMLGEALTKMTELGTASEPAVEAYLFAVHGTILHMINHSLVKLVLFLLAGVVFLHVGSYELNKVRGFGRKKPFLMVTFLLAAAGVSGIPLLNGYVSKTMLHESIVEYGKLVSEWNMGASRLVPYSAGLVDFIEMLFLFSGGLTIAYMTKLFVVLFIEKNQDENRQSEYEAKTQYMTILSKAAIVFCAVPIVLIGLFPHIVGGTLLDFAFPYNVASSLGISSVEVMHYFSFANLTGAVISIVVGAVVYFVAVRLVMLRRKEKGYLEIFPVWLNMEKYLYRAVFYTAVPFVLCVIARILDSIVDTVVVILKKTVYRERKIPYELPEGNYVTHQLGRSMENMRRIYCMVTKKKYEPKGYEHKLALMSVDLFENFRIIERSLSFGLFMFCVGLGLTMIYLLMMN